MKSARLLGVVVVLQGLILLGQWTGGPRISTAEAQVLDPGAQRIAMTEELKKTNEKLDRLISLLESGKVQVTAVMPDSTDSGARGR
jgi:hypothetical protein